MLLFILSLLYLPGCSCHLFNTDEKWIDTYYYFWLSLLLSFYSPFSALPFTSLLILKWHLLLLFPFYFSFFIIITSLIPFCLAIHITSYPWREIWISTSSTGDWFSRYLFSRQTPKTQFRRQSWWSFDIKRSCSSLFFISYSKGGSLINIKRLHLYYSLIIIFSLYRRQFKGKKKSSVWQHSPFFLHSLHINSTAIFKFDSQWTCFLVSIYFMA